MENSYLIFSTFLSLLKFCFLNNLHITGFCIFSQLGPVHYKSLFFSPFIPIFFNQKFEKSSFYLLTENCLLQCLIQSIFMTLFFLIIIQHNEVLFLLTVFSLECFYSALFPTFSFYRDI